ncbi:hypothetical protein FACS1894113_2710 [Alphaproteobacteria bacterium]|nr:hypothetical protein FACS1894113_2710 [Alphaproteobacteria bacterium]
MNILSKLNEKVAMLETNIGNSQPVTNMYMYKYCKRSQSLVDNRVKYM